jgi:hypothetical protein
LWKKALIAGTMIFRSRKKVLCVGAPLSGLTVSSLFNVVEKSREHKDMPMQIRKRMAKLNWFTKNIPKEGAMTVARPGASMK